MEEFSLMSDDLEDGETLTSAQVFSRLEEAWLNEKLSPELLANRSEVIECMVQQLSAMQQNLERTAQRKNNVHKNDEHKNDLKTCIHRMEIERIRYVLSDLYRTRLHKIESHTAHLLDQHAQLVDPAQQRLTQAELTFAKDYQLSIDSHFQSLACRHMPSNLQLVEGAAGTRPGPHLDQYVFARVGRDVSAVVEEETDEVREEVVDMKVGDQHIMRYKPLSGLVESGHVLLI